MKTRNQPKTKKSAKVDIVGHFNFSDGSCPDGVARWTEAMFGYLRGKGWDVEGFAICGSSRDNEQGKVTADNPTELANKIREASDADVAIVRGDATLASVVLETYKQKGVKTIFVMPYWGLHDGVYKLAEQSDILVTGIKPYADALRSETGRDCRYAPWPIDLDFWTPGTSNYLDQFLQEEEREERVFKVVYAGRLGIGKKIHRFVAPFKKEIIDRGHSDFRLMILGPAEDDQGERLKEEIEKNNARGSVVYVPRYFTSEEMREIYRASDAFIFATSWESYGTSQFEALGCGTPATMPVNPDWKTSALPSAANMKGYPLTFKGGEICGSSGKRIEEPNHDWQEACDGLLWIRNNYKTARKIAEGWRTHIKDSMSPQKVGSRIEGAIEDLLMS